MTCVHNNKIDSTRPLNHPSSSSSSLKPKLGSRSGPNFEFRKIPLFFHGRVAAKGAEEQQRLEKQSAATASCARRFRCLIWWMTSVVTRRTKLNQSSAIGEGRSIQASECASPSQGTAQLTSLPRAASVASDENRSACVPHMRFAALPITVLPAPVARHQGSRSSNLENESPARDDLVQRRALPKRSCTVSTISGVAPAAFVVSQKLSSSDSNPSPIDAAADFQNSKRKKKRAETSAADSCKPAPSKNSASIPPIDMSNDTQANTWDLGQKSTLKEFGFPVVNFVPKPCDVEVTDRSRNSTLSLYGFSEPKFKPKVCSTNAAAPLVQSDILKFCVTTDKPSIINIEDSPEHCRASAAAEDTPPTACRKLSSAECRDIDAVSCGNLDEKCANVLPLKRVRKPDSSPETLDEHRRLVYHQLRTPAMCHEDSSTGKLVFRCAGHILRNFATNNKGGLKMLTKNVGLDFNRLHDKSLFWRKRKSAPLFVSDITEVLRLGAVEGVRPCFAFEGYVYPVGFISRFVYTSFEDHHFDIYYQFGVVDCKICPLFYMVSETYDVARYYHVATSPAELWEAFEKLLHTKFDEPVREASYEEIFGYGLPDVVAAIACDVDGECLSFMVNYATQLKDFTRTRTLQELDEDEWLDDSRHPWYVNCGKPAASRELSAHQKAVMRSRQQKKPETDSEEDDPVELRVPAGEFLWHGKAGFSVEDMTLKFRRPVLELFTGCKIKEQDALDIDFPTPEPVKIGSSSKKKRSKPILRPAPAKKLEFIRELPRVQAHALKIGAALPMNLSGSARTQPYVPMTFLQKLPFITIADQFLPPELSSPIRYSRISDTERWCPCGSNTVSATNVNSFRYKLMRQHLHSTLAVGLSSIHGRGLFLLHPVMQHQMLIEYTGELIRYHYPPSSSSPQSLIL